MRTILWSLLVAFFATTCSLSLNAQGEKLTNNPWEFSAEPNLKNANQVRQIIPNIYQTAKVDLDALKDVLNQAPQRFSAQAKSNPVVLTLPMPDGGYEQFEIQEASIMHPELAAKFPEIKSYSGQGIDDPTASVRFDITPAGFHAMVRSGKHSTAYIDPYALGNTEDYVIYFRKDFAKIVPEEMVCHFDDFNDTEKVDYSFDNNNALKVAGDCDLRTFRLALACTGEYATFHGGTTAGAMAAMNTTMVRVNGIFERDAAITMVLVPNNDQLIYLDAGSDPYTNSSGGTMLGQNQTTCDNVIGSANYDIGHVFSTGGGGVAYLQSPCNNNSKAGGVTGQNSPVGDPFDVDYVAHEMGHQYGANHTQNNSCNRNSSTAMEPGSASTIMGYAGICSPNVQNNSDDHFHAISLQEMGNFMTGNNSNCAVTTVTGNNAPTVNGGPNYTIPGGTKFMLTATGNDADGNGSLTYCWEQFDNEVGSMPPSGTNTVGPMFRSNSPTSDPTRYFPNLNDAVNNVSPTWEVLATVDRTMDFRVTVRDNNMGAGCTDEDNVTVTVDGDTGPFVVTAPNTNVTWNAGATETVTWDVAGTTGAPVNAANVDILLSTDGGFTYPITLAMGVTNDGSHTVSVPNNPTTTARVMVKGANNIFFDISNQNFTINGSVDDFFLAVTPADQTVCQPQNATYTAAITATGSFSGNVSMSATGVPAGATATFSPTTVNTQGNSTLTISNTAAAAPGTYNIVISATGSTGTKTETVTLTVAAGAPGAIALTSPSNGSTGVSGAPTLTWNAAAGATSYDVQVSTSPNFSPLAASANVTGTSYTVSPALAGNTQYFWRVRGMSACGTGNFSSPFSFTTANETCVTYVSPDVPVNISSSGTPTITSTLNITDAGTINDVNVTNLNIDHSWTADLTVSLTSPTGTTITLINQICGQQDDIDLNLDDEASNAYSDIPCPAVGGGTYQPNEALSAFDGEDLNGTWTLTITDSENQDGGSLNSWELGICFEPVVTNPLVITASATDALCNGGQDGTATATASGGTGNYTYSWSNNASGSSISGLAAGTYTVTVDDGNTTATTSVTVGQPAPIVLSVTGTDLNCNGDNSGTASASATGGAGNFTYSWGANGNGANIGNLPAGTYTVTVFDGNQCSTTGSVTISEPASLGLEVIGTDAGCSGDDGSATASTSGGTGNVTYAWSNNATGATVTGLTPGTYSVTATDANGCTDASTVQIGQTGSNLSVSATATNSNCAANNGTATASASGGTGIIAYEWSNGAVNQTISNLAPGTYTVTATDGNGCTGTATVQVNQIGSNMQVSVTGTDASCGASDGTATATAFGGTGNITYAWSNNQSGQTIDGLAAGAYSVTATDTNGCTATGSVNIGQNGSTVEVTTTSTDANCSANDGTASASANGGTAGYTYVWNTGQTGATIGNLAPGNYSVIATDANGCTGEATVQVGQTGSNVQVSTTSTDANCAANDGTASASANGGTAGYTYVWNTGQTGATIGNLAPGTYSVIATDANGCTGEATVQVGQTGSTVQVSATATDANCSANDGTASASANGGTAGYTYVWNTGQTGATIGNLAPGTYSVIATDANGCTGEATVQVGQVNSNLQVTATAMDESCAGGDGSATATSTGGVGNVTYVWSNNQTGATISNLTAGTYTVIATDGNGCTGTATATVNATPAMDIETASTDVSCFGGADGTASVFINGGTQPYTINWSNGASGATITGLPAGQYSVEVIDGNGCIATGGVAVFEPQPLSVSVTGTNANGGNNGTATANPNGGTAPYTYLWNTQATTQTIDGLAPAVYSVVVTDANGCTTAGDIVIEDVTPPVDDYCVSAGENTFYEWIESVTVGNINNPSGNNNGYADFTGLVVEMEQGGSTGISLTPGFNNTIYRENWRVWIDYNQDGDFDDQGELVFAPAESQTTVSGSIDVPLSADLGETRMRIAMKWGGVPSPCEFFTYGEVEDYTVNISEGNGGGCTNVVIDSNNFEGGWGIWNDGGSDCRRSINDAAYANSGEYCIRLRDNTNSSTMTTDPLSLATFEEVTVDFTYITRSMDNANEDFWLQISTDGGQFFTTVEEWNLGDEFENGVREFDAVTIEGPFTNNTVFRFRCDASANYDWVFIDDVTISGCTNSNTDFFDNNGTMDFVNHDIDHNVQNEVAPAAVKNLQLNVYPNPVNDQLTVDYQLTTAGEANLVVFDLTGKMVHQQVIDNTDAARNQAIINVAQFNNGYYYLRIIGENESKAVKFLKF